MGMRETLASDYGHKKTPLLIERFGMTEYALPKMGETMQKPLALFVLTMTAALLLNVTSTKAEDDALTVIENHLLFCSGKTTDDEKLDCYKRCVDNIKEKRAKVTANQSDASAGDKNNEIAEKDKSPWIITRDKSAMDDSKTFIASQFALDGDKAKGMFVLRCKENETDAFIRVDEFLGTNNTYVVRYRIDSEKPQKAYWTPATNYKGVFAPKPIKFLKSLVGKKKLLIRLSPYSAADINVTVNLEGIEDIVKELGETCNWKK